jgi:WG containing repeat
MTVHRLIVVAAMVLCACALVVAGCGSSVAAVTAESTVTTGVSGLYPVSVDGKWGYIDNTGTIKIQPQYLLATPFSEGLAAVSTNGGWGYIDTSGTIVIQPQFGYVAPFSEGLASVGKLYGDLHGFIDKTGTVVIPMQYMATSAFSQGLCKVVVEESGSQKSGYIDKTGTMAIEPKFPGAGAGDFSEGLAAVGDSRRATSTRAATGS